MGRILRSGRFGIVLRATMAMLATLVVLAGGDAHAEQVAAAKPILFYQVLDAKYFGGGSTETDDHLAQAMLHDRLVPLLHSMLGTEIVNVNLGAPTTAQITTACSANGAIGAVAVRNTWQVEPDARSAAIVQVTFQNCTGTDWFTTDGTAYRATAHDANLSSMMDESITNLSEHLTKIVHDTPNAASNFVHYGFYMNDAEADSFWTVAIENGKVKVDYCDPIGTAFRAGLRVGDEVSTINGAATDGVDQARLNAILENAKRAGPWMLTVRSGTGPSRELTFRNEPVSWYAAHLAP